MQIKKFSYVTICCFIASKLRSNSEWNNNKVILKGYNFFFTNYSFEYISISKIQIRNSINSNLTLNSFSWRQRPYLLLEKVRETAKQTYLWIKSTNKTVFKHWLLRGSFQLKLWKPISFTNILSVRFFTWIEIEE